MWIRELIECFGNCDKVIVISGLWIVFKVFNELILELLCGLVVEYVWFDLLKVV